MQWWTRLKGNARGCLAYEPLFLIPYSMFMTYSTIYMYRLGLNETQIGWITSLGLAVQVLASLISGYLTDRLGRRRALLLFDLLSWTLGTLLWAASGHVWMFALAAFVNGFQRIPHIAFTCLLIEDTPPRERAHVFTVLQFIGVVGGLFAPLGGLLVDRYGVIAGERIMFVLACICMTTQFIGRHYSTHETEIGLRRMRETKGESLWKGLAGYGAVTREIAGNRPLLLIFAVYILFNFQMTLKTTFFSLYAVEQLQVGSGLVSVFPAATSVIMLLTMVLVMPRIGGGGAQRAMQLGFLISALSSVLLVIPGAGGWLPLSLSTILGAAGLMLSSPYLEAAVQNAIDDDRRAGVFAMLSVIILVVITPSGIIGGWAYAWDPRVPFVLIALSFAASMALLATYARRARQSAAHPM